ncbi:MAG: hypothetical protein ACK5KR_01605 [Breznakia sp.]
MKEVTINRILAELLYDDNLTADKKICLLLIKHMFDNNKNMQTDIFTNFEFLYFFLQYKVNISQWLAKPVGVVEKKVYMKSFSSVEISLIITNLFLLLTKEADKREEGV